MTLVDSTLNFGTYGKPDYWNAKTAVTRYVKNRYGKKIKDTSFVRKECPKKWDISYRYTDNFIVVITILSARQL